MENINLMTDSDLISSLKEDQKSSECLMELVDRHSGIYMTMVNNYTPKSNKSGPTYKTELISDKNYYIYQAALKYNEEKKTKFSTYLGNETRWMCLNLYNREKNKSMKEVSTDDEDSIIKLIDPQNVSQDFINSEITQKINQIIEDDPDSRISKVFKMRYSDPAGNKLTPWRRISEKLNLSIQGCINIHNRTIDRIKKELKKEL
jgi:RNA polymerase sigma factor (sigma-70 family)